MGKKLVKLSDKITFGDGKIYLQTMGSLNYDCIDLLEKQIEEIKKTNCSIFRLSVRNINEAYIANDLRIKYERDDFIFCADTHFDTNISKKCIELGFRKIRINPGNMNNSELIDIYKLAALNDIVIRIGLNGGSCRKILGSKPTCKSVIKLFNEFIEFAEKQGFYNIILSAKFSDFRFGLKVNEALYNSFNYPIHLGVTEAGDLIPSTIKHSIFLNKLIEQNIGDTIRVSITGNPLKELEVLNEILKINKVIKGIELISCPTCGRTWGNLDYYVRETRKLINKYDNLHFQKNIKIAIMGCEVNGPGEAEDADYGIALAKNNAIVFRNGKIIKKINKNEIIDEIKRYLDNI